MSNTETKTKNETTASTSSAPQGAASSTMPTNPFAAFAPFSAPFTAFDPTSAWAATQQTFHKMMADTIVRAEAFAAQYAALEAQMLSRAQSAVANWAQLAQDAIAYSAQLSAEARKLGLEAARHVGANKPAVVA